MRAPMAASHQRVRQGRISTSAAERRAAANCERAVGWAGATALHAAALHVLEVAHLLLVAVAGRCRRVGFGALRFADTR